MLEQDVVKKIRDFVRKQPRTIQDIAQFIDTSWVTADRYVEKIAAMDGAIAVKTFRGGTKGALKIAYWTAGEPQGSQAQERLLRQIEAGHDKYDFSPSDIYQHVAPSKKKAWLMPYDNYISKANFERYQSYLLQAERQVLFFSGNLTFSKLAAHDKKILDIMEDLARKGVDVKILTSVDLRGLSNIKNVLSINDRVGRNAIEIRHCYQPLRATVIDRKIANFKETRHTREDAGAKDELAENVHILYDIYDEEWIEWIEKVFWHLYRSSADAKRRIADYERMTRLKK